MDRATRPSEWPQTIPMPGVEGRIDHLSADVKGQRVKTGTSNTPQSNIDKLTWDAERGLAKINGLPAGFIGIQSYPGSPVAFRDIWIK